MSSTRSLKLLVLLGLTAVIVISMGASTTSTAAMSQSVQVLERQGSSLEDPVLLSAARVRAEIPSNFMQPVVPYDASELSPDDYIRAAGPHTIRDEIPSEFIYPLASDTAQDLASLARIRAKIPSDFIQPVVPYDPGEVSPGEFMSTVASASIVRGDLAEGIIELHRRQEAAGDSTVASVGARYGKMTERILELLKRQELAGQDQLAQVRAATAQFHQTEAAYAAGYTLVPGLDFCFNNPGVGGMGIHLIKTSSLDLTVEALQPEAMVYQLGPNGQLELVAVEYIVPAAAWDAAGNTQPPSVLGQSFHLNSALGVYILHAWIWQENPLGMFQDWNPKVSCP